MYNVFQSETKVAEVILKDNSGTVIDPTLETMSDIEVILTSKLDGKVIGLFSRETKTGWTTATVSSTNILCYVYDFNTKGQVEAQVNILVPDANLPNGVAIHTQKGIICTVSESYK